MIPILIVLLVICVAGFAFIAFRLNFLAAPKDLGASSSEAALQARLDAASEMASSLKSELEASRKSALEAAGSLARKEEEVKGIAADRDRLRAEAEAAKSAEAAASAKLQNAERELAAFSESLKLTRTALEEGRGSIAKLEVSLKAESDKSSSLAASRSKLQAEFDSLAKRLESQEGEMKRLQAEALSKFEAVAAKLLEEKGDKMSKLHAERLAEILTPLRENIGEFKKRVEEAYEKDSKDRAALGEQVRQVSEMNRKVGEDAKRLADALKGDSKLVGDWGEMLLDSILEGSGLIRNQEYFKQESVRDPDGKLLRPDILIKMPHGKTIVIDSKVSIAAYIDYSNSPDEAGRVDASERHMRSVKAHVDELASKDYQSHVGGSLDFVVMFIPNEPAYNLAMRCDSSLWQYAYNKKVILSSPTNLFAILKIASELWRKEREAGNYLEIAERGAAIYDKLAVFLDFMEDARKGLDDARRAYDKAANSLKDGRGNLIGQVEKMKQLGLKAKRQIDDAWLDRDSAIPAEASQFSESATLPLNEASGQDKQQ